MDRGDSMHTEQSRDPSSSSAGRMPPPLLLLPLWAVMPAAAVVIHPGAAIGGAAADCSSGSWVVDTVALTDMWNGRYGFLAALIMGMPGPGCCKGPTC